MAGEKKRQLSDAASWEMVLRDHPQWRRAWEKGKLPDEIVGDDDQPVSPHLHLQMHAVAERQLAVDEPKGVAAIARELQELGVSPHDVRHEIGAVIAEHMWYTIKERCPFDEGRYLSELRAILERKRG